MRLIIGVNMKISRLSSYIIVTLLWGVYQSADASAQKDKTDPKHNSVIPSLYYSGTSNGWEYEKMEFDLKNGQWHINTNFTGQGDGSGPQRFRIYTKPNKKAKSYGGNGNQELCDDVKKCTDVVIPEVGNYTLTINEADMSWFLTKIPEKKPYKHLNALYYAGTTNKWTHEPMMFDPETGEWKITLKLTGVGDEHGPQRFKVTTTPDWNGDVYGSDGLEDLCSIQGVCNDVWISEVGTYELAVKESNMHWSLTKSAIQQPLLKHLYFSGTTNKWTHTPMSYDSSTGAWKLILKLNGSGDSSGPQRFKLTTTPDWNGVVYGSDGRTELCSVKSVCKDVIIDEVGTYELVIDESNMGWRLDKLKGPSPKFTALYYTGTSNNWDFYPLDYDQDSGNWRITLFLNGRGDKKGRQRFKLSTRPVAMQGDIYGSNGGDALCNAEDCKDVDIDGLGTYVLSVNDKTNMWTLERAPEQISQLGSLYYAGTSNGWKHDAMSFDKKTGEWKILINLNGMGDDVGFQRFKVTTTPDWDGDVYGSDGRPALCALQSVCGDVLITEAGTYYLIVNESTMHWRLERSEKQIKQHKHLMYQGTTNQWGFDPMNFNEATGEWEIMLNFNGEGDESGPQRFRIATRNDEISEPELYGAPFGRPEQLCQSSVVCTDIQFTEVGKYLLSVNDATMTWKITKQSAVNVAPIAGFNVSKDELKVTFTNLSSDPDNNQLSYQWSFGDGTVSNDQNAVHTYPGDGIYTVTLTVFDGELESSVAQDVEVQVNMSLDLGSYEPLYYAGTTNGWKHQEMKYDKKSASWVIDLDLTGKGDENGPQRFKVTSTPDWLGRNWGTAGGVKLCDNESVCEDVFITEIGKYQLQVSSVDMTWKLVPLQ